MHRVVGAGRPVICSRTKHFVDIEEDVDCLKFGDQNELELKIKEALRRRGELWLRCIWTRIRNIWRYDKYE